MEERKTQIGNAIFEVPTVVGHHKAHAAQEKFFLNCLSLENAWLYSPSKCREPHPTTPCHIPDDLHPQEYGRGQPQTVMHVWRQIRLDGLVRMNDRHDRMKVIWYKSTLLWSLPNNCMGTAQYVVLCSAANNMQQYCCSELNKQVDLPAGDKQVEQAEVRVLCPPYSAHE